MAGFEIDGGPLNLKERPSDLPRARARRLPHHDRGVPTGGDPAPRAHREHPEPAPGRPYYAGTPLRLWGAVTEDDGALADPAGCSWRIGDRVVAQGLDDWIVAPAPGEHRCTFVVRGRGGDAEVEVVLRTVDPAETDPNRPGEVSKPKVRRDPGRRKGGRRSRR
jgi:hypothetical protein